MPRERIPGGLPPGSASGLIQWLSSLPVDISRPAVAGRRGASIFSKSHPRRDKNRARAASSNNQPERDRMPAIRSLILEAVMIRYLARDLYRLEREVDELNRRLPEARPADRLDIELQLRRVTAERDEMRARLAAKKSPPTYPIGPH